MAIFDESQYPWLDWFTVQSYVNKNWDPENTPHHAIVASTGSGKSFLAINGILEVCKKDRVLIIDTKGDDKLVSNTGNSVSEIPNKPWYTPMLGPRDKPRQYWYRLVVSDDYAKARVQVYNALERVYRDGNWVVYVDEIYDLTAKQPPSLNLAPQVERILRKGRSRRISFVSGTQQPAWVPRSFFDQSDFAWIGRIRDEQRQKRLTELGGMGRQDLPIVTRLRKREWLLSADGGDYFARTIVRI